MIVHGGPLSIQTAYSIVNFYDALAAQALDWTMDGLLSEVSVAHHFASRQAQYADALEALAAGAEPAAALPVPARA